MSCAKYQDRLSDYIDGALSEQERIELERHMRECWSCWVMREDLLYIRQLSRELPDYEPSPQLWDRIVAAIASENASRSSKAPLRMWRFRMRPAFALAAAILVAALAGALLQSRSPLPGSQNANLSAPVQWNTLSSSLLEIQPTALLLVHKPTIDSEIVEQRIEVLERQVQNRRALWDAETETCFRRCWEAIERSLSHCRYELERDPENAVLRELYLAALKAKLELLKHFSEL